MQQNSLMSRSMEYQAGRNHTTLRAIEFKGRMATLNVIRIKDADPAVIREQIQDKVNQAPEFFRQLPILVDLDEAPDIDVSAVTAICKENKLTLLGLLGGNPDLEERAQAIELPVLPPSMFGNDRRSAPANAEQKPAQETEQKQQVQVAEPLSSSTSSLLIKQPVRSGQQIYARGGDLVVLASVGAGAEVLADGHIHVYGPMRGRALAGVQGDTEARIFCHSLEAELVSVAGSYILHDDLPSELVGQPVQVSMVNDQLRIDRI